MPFELIHKPTFTNQLFAIPKERILQILEKIEVLRDDPKPHGNLKKKLHGYKGDVYRLRSGDYRIIYTYGDKWVALLGVDARKDVYKGSKLVAETNPLDVSNLPDLSDVLTPNATPTPQPQNASKEILLPVQLTEELLTRLLVPNEYFPILLSCRTLDELLSVDIPSLLIERIFDCITSPNFDRVLDQPSFVTGNTGDLLRFTEGELLGFLLKLNPEQEKFVTWALNASGPTLLKGGPGTGKSTVALYRVQALIEILKKSGVSEPKILFTTYTNALIAYSEQLLQSLLGEDARYVEVKTADKVAWELLSHNPNNLKPAESGQLRTLIKQILPHAIATLEGNTFQCQAQTQTLQRLTIDYLLEEIGTVIEGRGIKTLNGYQTTPRTGRAIALNKLQRQAIWHLRQHLYQKLADAGLETWHQLRSRAVECLQTLKNPPIYDAVLIDETQDLEPNALRLLIGLCRAPNRLFVTADANQSIYGSSFRWSDVHQDLKFAGRTGILYLNHRTTKEISEAAHNYLANGILEDEIIERAYVHTGPPPAVRSVSNRYDEGELVKQFCQAAAHEFRLGIHACAVLTPTERAGKKLAEQLNYLGLKADFMSSRELDLNRQGVKVLTLKSAKGLEFPITVIAGFLDAPYPTIPKGTPEEEIAELLARERRTLFVGMTRAMRALLVIVPQQTPSPLLQNFNPDLWNLGTTA
ncbi:AAA family ATPase [Ancylothrix sp. C2]|uniref:UvrD-helicase domain-containing protein n=1 Tax=Ancylothrix sp. D3o TaxID=2953691 RepID=UPI0021BA3DBB|nr:UvrD-helicase domain-containing protein [Ancylothrix sp. D3o]MCT7953080.1 AAA family ATPase [Ancylothrix sp. D3o]